VKTSHALCFLLVVGALAVGACARKSNLDAPRAFFEKQKIGDSPDYAVIKWGDPSDHVVTVHGFLDDSKSCQIIVDALNKDACNETYGENCLNPFSCLMLNH
jgi:hypothetical protein